MKALPEPDFKYFSNVNALYLSLNSVETINLIGRMFAVAGTWPLLCLVNLSSIFDVQPTYVVLLLQARIYT